MSTHETMSAIESILFSYGEPLSVARIGQALELSEEAVLQGLSDLVERYEQLESGLSLVRIEDRVQLVTKGDNAVYIEKFTKSAMQESLSKAALEVLAVIAYRGPIARSEIEAIRGVNCSVTLRSLLLRELIERKENEDDARGYLYTISFQFLKELGLQSVSELPEYEALMHDERVLLAIESLQSAQKE
ncbi:MAG: SMC-Scp complex subunit ScpB [Candidatus Moranbacteria bacterium]|nr:SMC-Scp complex subunit ScpB [Candidatus Moranbacteria bacterium]